MVQRRLTKAQRIHCVHTLTAAAGIGSRLPSADEIATTLPLIVQMIDEDVAKALIPQDDKIPAADRLFDVLMVRLECLQPYRAGILALGESLCHSPKLSFIMYKLQIASLRGALELSDITDISTLRLHVLLGLYHLTLSKWGEDSTPDLSPTMAFLNSSLQKLEANHFFA